MRPACVKGDRIEEQNHLRSTSARRSQAALSRHRESKTVARLGTQDRSGDGPANVAGVFQKRGCGRNCAVSNPAGNWQLATALRALRRSRREVNQLLHSLALVLAAQRERHAHPVAWM